MDNSAQRKTKKGSARTIALFVVGGLLTLSIPLTYVLWSVLSFFMSICFLILCTILPFMLPLVIPEGGGTEDIFDNILQGLLEDRPASINAVSVILTLVGIGILAAAVVSLSKRKQSSQNIIPVSSTPIATSGNLNSPIISSQPSVSHKKKKFDWFIPIAIAAAVICLLIGFAGWSSISSPDAPEDDNSTAFSKPINSNSDGNFDDTYNPLLGEWDWGIGGYAVINADGTMYVYQDSSKNPRNVFSGTYEFSDKVETANGNYLPNAYKITLTINEFQENGKTVNAAIGEQNIFIFSPNPDGYYDVYNYRTGAYNRAIRAI